MRSENEDNIDHDTVISFGNEWNRFDQSRMTQSEIENGFNEYFDIFPWDLINSGSIGFDMGCGSGRWARFVSPKVGHLNCVEPSDAINIAERELYGFKNISFIRGSVTNNNLTNESQDFGYSIGVLHHIPNTRLAIKSCVKLLKSGSPFLLYIYYALDNRSIFFKITWRTSNLMRKVISKLPLFIRNIVTDIVAVTIYMPLSILSNILEKIGINTANIPLSYYKNRSFYTMRTDSRDRLGTPLEQRFTKDQIKEMMTESGLGEIVFSTHAPFWCAVGIKK